jgi:inhibitor of KinA sporulation pathway (predicted exonuclease)
MAKNSMCLVAQIKKWRRVIRTVKVTICCSKLAANQKAVDKQSAFSSSWQAAVGWLRTVC